MVKKAEAGGLKNGVVQDKLWVAGILKLKRLIDSEFFGRILSVRGEFGYWVFTGEDQPCSARAGTTGRRMGVELSWMCFATGGI